MIGPLQRSLKTRVTLFSLVIFALSLWALAYFTSKMLRTDMERLLGDQQLSTVSLVAANINQELTDRLTALQRIAADFNEKELKSPAELQSILERRPILPLLFNGGAYVTDAAGTATASIPVEAGRVGMNYMFRNSVAAALGEGKSTVGTVIIGRQLRVPVFSLAVPIHDAQGKVIGSLSGAINLSSDNFLDRITANAYGRTGGYLLVDRQQRLIVTATDKSRVMETLPPPGVIPAIDDFLAGHEGSHILRNARGVEVLGSAKNIPVADWYAAATLTTEEAFAPIHDMQQHMLLATVLLTLIAGGLTWWMLRHQLAPIGAAAAALRAHSGHGLLTEPLPVTSRDEIGQLISNFNSLLHTLATRERALKASENRFSLFMDFLPGSAFIKDEDGSMLYANRYLMDIVGARIWQGKTTREIFPPEIAEKMIADDLRAMAAGYAMTEESVLIADGRLRHFETHKFSLSSQGQPQLLGGIALDITERKQAEETLRRNIKDLKETQRIAHTGNWRLDLATNQVVWSEELYKMYGFDPSLPVPPYPEHMKLFTPSSWERLSSALARTTETGIPYMLELEMVREDGGKGWMWVQGEVETDSAGKTVALWGAAQDITERKRAEEELRNSEERYRVITDYSPVGIFQTDAQGDYNYVNRRWMEITGLTMGEAMGKGWRRALHPDDTQRISEYWYEAAILGSPYDWECRFLTKQGKQSWISGHAEAIADQQGDINGYLGVIVDITSRKQAEEEIRLAEVRFRSIIEASPVPFALNDRTLNIVFLNTAFIQTFGYDQNDIPTVEAWWPKAYPDVEYRQEIMKEWSLRLDMVKRDAEPFEPLEVRIHCKDGSERTVLATATPLGWSVGDLHLVTLYDITERKQAERTALEALARIDRLAQHVPGMVYEFHLRPDGSSHFPYTSIQIEDIYGVLPEQVSNDAEAVFRAIHPGDIQRVTESIQASARTVSDWHEEYRVRLPDGRTIWVEGESSPEVASDGGVIWYGHIRDITERKATESLLHEQLAELNRWQKLMLGREGRIISMKQEVNELLTRFGQPPRYADQPLDDRGQGAAQTPRSGAAAMHESDEPK